MKLEEELFGKVHSVDIEQSDVMKNHQSNCNNKRRIEAKVEILCKIWYN